MPPLHLCKNLTTLSFLLAAVEALLITSGLALFAFGYPDDTRNRLWKEGGMDGFNSNPELRIYFYANYREPPPIPFIWSQSFTDFNVSVGLISFWVFITRMILVSMDIMDRWTELFLQCCVLPFWILSVIAQKSPDYTDSEHPSQIPWYLTHSCSASQAENRAACHVAQASFGVSAAVILFYSVLIWRTVAPEGLGYLLRKQKIAKESTAVISNHAYNMEDLEGDLWSNDESPLMRAWDEQ